MKKATKKTAAAKSGKGKAATAVRSKKGSKQKLKVFKLSMKKWLRGGSENMRSAQGSSLRDKRTGTYCCIGMLAVQCGISPRKLNNIADPRALVEEMRVTARRRNRILTAGEARQRLPEEFRRLTDRYGQNTRLVNLAIGINDDVMTTDEEKIEKLRPVFARLGSGYRIEIVK